MPSDWLASIRDRFVAERLAGVAAIRALPPEEAKLHATQALKNTRGSDEVDKAMRSQNLAPVIDRARVYAPFSRATSRVRMVCVIPYTSGDHKSHLVGTVGISDDEPVSGVVVELKEKSVVRATLFDYIGGKLVQKTVVAQDLLREGPKKFVERWKRDKIEPHLSIETAQSVSRDAFQSLLIDDYASLVYTEEDVRQLAYNAPFVTAIAELQHMRHLGVPTADSCCCCCTCSWGCCSSCSAISESYLSHRYGLWST
jgi:hypothetical protein